MIAYKARESCLPGRGAVSTARGIRVDTKVSTLMNPVSFWDSTAKFAELRLAKERQSGYSFVPFSAFSQFTDNILLHMRATLRWARHARVAQLFYALFQTTPAQIDYTKPINPQVLSIYSRLTTCAALSSPRGPSLALRAIHLVSRLR